MTNLTIRKGSRLNLVVYQADPDSISATFIAHLDDPETTIQDTVAYTDGEAHFEIQDTDVVGVYDYQVNENFTSGNPDIYPADGDCDEEDCEFPTLEICESLEQVG